MKKKSLTVAFSILGDFWFWGGYNDLYFSLILNGVWSDGGCMRYQSNFKGVYIPPPPHRTWLFLPEPCFAMRVCVFFFFFLDESSWKFPQTVLFLESSAWILATEFDYASEIWSERKSSAFPGMIFWCWCLCLIWVMGIGWRNTGLCRGGVVGGFLGLVGSQAPFFFWASALYVIVGRWSCCIMFRPPPPSF